MKKEKNQKSTPKKVSPPPTQVSADEIQSGFPVYESEEYTTKIILGTTKELGWKQET